jgi:hypothetical protein
MAELRFTRQMLSRARVIARGRGIRELDRLLRIYGGTPAGWTKRATRPMRDPQGPYEYHWYEHHGVGRFEVKRIRLRD